MGKYKDLIVWQKSMDLVEEVYNTVKALPSEEKYALSDQMRRAAVSIPSNIAEGQERISARDFAKFLYYAKGSKSELETQFMICIRLNYLTQEQAEAAQNMLSEIGKMLNSLIRKLSLRPKLPSHHYPKQLPTSN
ncbi:MAG: four helix bundle protein [Clostridiales bacterium]|nr:four helix bundle protein [Clostridiales bacterium]